MGCADLLTNLKKVKINFLESETFLRKVNIKYKITNLWKQHN